MSRRWIIALLCLSFVLLLGPGTLVWADDDDDDDRKLQAVPFEFVGKAGDCGDFPFGSGTPYPAGSRIVTSAWLGGMGLPDNGGQNTSAAEVPDVNATPPFSPTPNPNRRDRHLGLLLSKNGPTPDCSAPGAEIKRVKGIKVTADFKLGFDYRNGGHCGAGAPRFNVVVRNPNTGDDTFHFVGGCANDSTPTAAPQDPAQWTRVRFDVTGAESFPPIPVGSKIRSIDLIHDEGTDTANNDTQGVGLAVVDNIDINGRLITRGSGIADGNNRDNDKDDKDDDDDD